MHINTLIEDIIDDIERVLRYLYQKYFNHYHQLVVQITGEENAGENWGTLLEYGTQNRIVIALQNLGLSRSSANLIYRSYGSTLTIENQKLKAINKTLLLSSVSRNSLAYKEINNVL